MMLQRSLNSMGFFSRSKKLNNEIQYKWCTYKWFQTINNLKMVSLVSCKTDISHLKVFQVSNTQPLQLTVSVRLAQGKGRPMALKRPIKTFFTIQMTVPPLTTAYTLWRRWLGKYLHYYKMKGLIAKLAISVFYCNLSPRKSICCSFHQYLKRYSEILYNNWTVWIFSCHLKMRQVSECHWNVPAGNL